MYSLSSGLDLIGERHILICSGELIVSRLRQMLYVVFMEVFMEDGLSYSLGKQKSMLY